MKSSVLKKLDPTPGLTVQIHVHFMSGVFVLNHYISKLYFIFFKSK